MLDAVLVELSGSNGGKQKYTCNRMGEIGKAKKVLLTGTCTCTSPMVTCIEVTN